MADRLTDERCRYCNGVLDASHVYASSCIDRLRAENERLKAEVDDAREFLSIEREGARQLAEARAEADKWRTLRESNYDTMLEIQRQRDEARAEGEHWRESRRAAIAAGDMMKEEIDSLRSRCDVLQAENERLRKIVEAWER